MQTFRSPRDSAALIVSQCGHLVKLDRQIGVQNAAQLVVERLRSSTFSADDLFTKTPVHPQLANKAGAEWVFFADTLNFSFWTLDNEPQYEVTYKGEKYTGYLSLCAAINRTLEAGIPLTNPDFYGTITEEQLTDYLMGDNNVPCPLMEERVRCLHEVSDVLKKRYEGSVVKFIQSSNKSAQALLKQMYADFPSFRDEAQLPDGQRVTILKRAQIFIADLWALFQGQNLGEFSDIDSLTMFADYRVPQSLQYFGVLKYSGTLLNALTANTLWLNGVIEEVAIRGYSIAAVDLIVEKVNEMLTEDEQRKYRKGERDLTGLLSLVFPPRKG